MKGRPFTIAVAVIAWFGWLLQCYLSVRLTLDDGRTVIDGLIVFLGFFTVTTNILVCLALTLPSIAPGSAAGKVFSSRFVAGGIATSIGFVALSYHFLLRHVWNPQGAQWLADVLLHYVVPVLFILHWFATSRDGTLRWVHPLYWSVYPTLYFIYSLVRGEIIGTYPYGFIDVGAIGYQRTVINALALLAAFLVLGCVFVGIDRMGRHPMESRR